MRNLDKVYNLWIPFVTSRTNSPIFKIHYFFFQSLLEVYAPDRAKVFRNKYMMFHHGGMLFWFATSCVFFLVCRDNKICRVFLKYDL